MAGWGFKPEWGFPAGKGFFSARVALFRHYKEVWVRGLGTGFMDFAGSHFYDEKFAFFLLKGLVSNGRIEKW